MSASSKDRKHPTEPSLTGEILTTREVAAYLRLSETTVCTLAASGELPGFKIGKSWRFDKGEVLGRIAAAKSAEKHVGNEGTPR